MEKSIYFSVSADVAERSTLKDVRYRTKDGRFILTDKDLQRVRLLPSEFITGIDAVMLKDKDEADKLIAAGGFLLGNQTTIFGETEEAPVEVVEEAPAEVAEPSETTGGEITEATVESEATDEEPAAEETTQNTKGE